MSIINTTQANVLYRDDDVGVHTDFYLFRKLHEEFINKEQDHTVGVIMKDLWENQAVFYYLATAPYLKVALHGWEHKDYSAAGYAQCKRDIVKSLHYWDTNVKRMLKVEDVPKDKKIEMFFAPWNKSSPEIKRACEKTGLRFCDVGGGWWEGIKVKSFHWWAVI
jgi:hypothetical protein